MNRPDNAPKLTEAQVLDVWNRLAAGQRAVDIAAHHGVSRTVVSKIRTRKTWRHLHPDPATIALARIDRCVNGHPRATDSYRTTRGRLRCRTCRKAHDAPRPRRPSPKRPTPRRDPNEYLRRHAGHDLRTRVDGTLVCYSCWRREHDIDEVAVARAVAGHRVDGLTCAEKELAALKLTAKGLSAMQIAALLDCSPRTVVRYRARGRQHQPGRAA